jgi:hypothetical protein
MTAPSATIPCNNEIMAKRNVNINIVATMAHIIVTPERCNLWIKF